MGKRGSRSGDVVDREGLPGLVFEVSEQESGARLDAFLGRQTDEVSRSRFKRLIQDGLVQVNSKRVKPGHELREGDLVAVWLPPARCMDEALQPEEMPLEVLYEDDDLLVVNKAPGVVVHPGAGHEEGTLVHGLLAHCSGLASQGSPLRPGIVHRLDRDTSGAMVAAKSDRAYLRLIELFKGRSVHKEYLALVCGSFGETRGEVRTLMDRHPVDRTRMAVSHRKGREAFTRWAVERAYGEVTLLRVQIETGRTHQIRVHMSHIQHPVVGDETYGGGRRRLKALSSDRLHSCLQGVRRHLLHASTLTFTHPTREIPLMITAPLSPDFQEILDALDQIYFPGSPLAF